MYLKQVLEQQKHKQEMRVQSLMASRFEKEKHLKEVYNDRDYQQKLKKETELIKREERLENV